MIAMQRQKFFPPRLNCTFSAWLIAGTDTIAFGNGVEDRREFIDSDKSDVYYASCDHGYGINIAGRKIIGICN